MDFNLPFAVVAVLIAVVTEKYLTAHCLDNYENVIRDNENNIGDMLKIMAMIITAWTLRILLRITFISCLAITIFEMVW